MRTPPEQQEEPSQNPNQQDPVPQDISSLYRDALLRPPEEEQEEPWMVPVRIGKLRKLRFKHTVDVSESFPLLEGQHLRREPFRAVGKKIHVTGRTVRQKLSSRERDSTRDREDLAVGKVSINFTDRPSSPEPSERRARPTAARGMSSTEPAKRPVAPATLARGRPTQRDTQTTSGEPEMTKAFTRDQATQTAMTHGAPTVENIKRDCRQKGSVLL